MRLLLGLFLVLLAPSVAYADFDTFLANVNGTIVNPIIELLFALAIAVFLWGMFEFIMGQASQEKKTNGKSHMLWGVLGITIMMGVWGILNLIINTFGLGGDIDVRNQGQNQGSVDVHLQEYNPKVQPLKE